MEEHRLARRQNPVMDQPGMPQLWMFLIIVLGVLLALVMSTSFVMHMIQRRQRKVLARRIANGEVDLEMLGLKRLNVPQEQVDKMPQYVWTVASNETIKRPEPAAKGEQTDSAPSTAHNTMFDQSTCAICLDEYVDNSTSVRELPCNHIFHPECIDPFLLNNSSLCPVCKKSALPAGYCPVQVTNVMVRRERLSRNLQQNRDRMRATHPSIRPYVRASLPTARIHNTFARSNNTAADATATTATATATDAPVPSTEATTTTAAPSPSQNQDVELGAMPAAVSSPRQDSLVPPPEIARQGQAARRAWRRERIVSLHIREFEQQGEASRDAEARRPVWRRILGVN